MPRKPTERRRVEFQSCGASPDWRKRKYAMLRMIASIRSFGGKRMSVVRDGSNVTRLCRPEPTPGAT